MQIHEKNYKQLNKHASLTKRTINTAAYLSAIRSIIEEGKGTSILVTGMSMFPFLEHERDIVYCESPKNALKRGDIVFYQRPNGQFVLHRICAVKDDGYYIIGDAQQVIEGPIKREQIFAIVTKVIRNGKELDASSPTWRFFERIWLKVIPARRYLMLPYRFAKKMRLLRG